MVVVRAWIFALLATVLVLLPSGGRVHAEHYCRMMGRVVASCCCDEAAAASTPHDQQQIRESDCCQRISSSVPSTLGVDKAVRYGHAAPAPQLTPSVVSSLELSLPDLGSCRESTQAPPALGPPLFVKHCALLS
jgi:hypothetical protein